MNLPGSAPAPHAPAPRTGRAAPWRLLTGTWSTWLIALVCGGTIVGIWLAYAQRVVFERDHAVTAAMEANANLAIAYEQQVFRTLKAAEQVAAFVREQYLQHGTAIDLAEWVGRGVIRDQMFTIVSVVDAAGHTVSSSQRTGPVNYADRAFFLHQRAAGSDQLFVSEPVFGRISGRWQVPMSLRITRADGSFAGVVVLSVDPAEFTLFHRQADLGPQGLMELTGEDGVVRARQIGQHTSFGLDASTLPWFQRRVTRPEGGYVDAGHSLDGRARILSYRSMADYPLMVTVATAYDEVMAPVLHRRTTYLIWTGAATVVLLVVAGLLALLLARQRAATAALQSSEALYRATFDQAATGIAHIAPDGRILGSNEKFCRMLGYSGEELRQRTVFDLSEESNHEAARQFLAHRLSPYSPVFSPEIEKPYRRKDGTALWVSEALGVVKDAQGRPDFLVAVVQDITARKDLEERLSHEALHDALTGLPNRVMFQDRLSRVLASARRYGRLAGLLYLDLDGFKAVNDNHGHAAGDLLLQQVAQRLEACVRAEDTVARLGGDEFAIVLAALSHEQDGELVAHKVLEVLAAPFDLNGATVQISGSVGAALYPLHGQSTEALVAHADSAMYAAKHAGKNRFSWDAQVSGHPH